MNIEIYVSGSVNQEIKLKEGINLSKKEVIEGIKSGKYFTSIGHNEMYRAKLIESPSLNVIGEVLWQDAGDDLEISIDEKESF